MPYLVGLISPICPIPKSPAILALMLTQVSILLALLAGPAGGRPARPMIMNSGAKFETPPDWQARRAEMIEVLEHWEYAMRPRSRR